MASISRRRALADVRRKLETEGTADGLCVSVFGPREENGRALVWRAGGIVGAVPGA